MKPRFILSTALLLASVALAGCEFNMPGTTSAYAQCVRDLSTQNLDSAVVVKACVRQNDAPVSFAIDRGVTWDSYGVQLYVTNNSPSLVVTAFAVEIGTNNGKHAQKSTNEAGWSKQLFLQPGEAAPIHFFPADLNGITVEDTKDATGKPAWWVNATATRGLTIQAAYKLSP
jgi:hypothetical protein